MKAIRNYLLSMAAAIFGALMLAHLAACESGVC